MRRTVKLLGAPAILDQAGRSQDVRGHKAWALLSRALLTRAPLDRRNLATELFPDAEDPLGSLRWCLASLRKALGSPGCLSGDPIVPNLPADVHVDVLRLDDLDLETVGPLLDGVEPKSTSEFSTWLLVERERQASLVASRLRMQTIRAISAEDHEHAIRLAELGARREPLNESAHVLLVRSLTGAGHHAAALSHVEATERLFLAELGEKPSPALRSAARRTVSSPPAGISRAAFVKSLLEAGQAALLAGAIDAGIDCLRRAAHDASETGDLHLLARTWLDLGTALVHALRAHADEGCIYLQRSTDLARRRGYASLAAAALRELGFVENKAGRRPAAASYLAEAFELAEGREALAGILAVIGLNLVDWGRPEEGLAQFALALDHARSSGHRRHEMFSLAFGARGLLVADRPGEAERWLKQCLDLVDEHRWIAFRPWPVALLCESTIRQRRDAEVLRPRLEEAFALSCQLDDPCWEVAVARAIALGDAADGDLTEARNWLAEARRRCGRKPGLYRALEVEVLASQTEVSLAAAQPGEADEFAHEWLSLAARTHMNAHVARAADFVTSLGQRNSWRS